MADSHKTHSLGTLIRDIVHRKARAAQARFAGTQLGQEPPREVYLAACATIGAHLHEGFGFRYAKSGAHARRKSGDFSFEVGFQSSYHNVAGEHVQLVLHACVFSPRVKRWRASQPLLHSSDWIAGGQIGNLRQNSAWLTWELADPGTREASVRDAIQIIEEVALPYFARFENLPGLFESLVDEDIPSLDIRNVVELLMCFAEPTLARRAGAAFLRRRAELLPAYRHAYEQYAKSGLLREATHAYAPRLAFASHLFELGYLGSDA